MIQPRDGKAAELSQAVERLDQGSAVSVRELRSGIIINRLLGHTSRLLCRAMYQLYCTWQQAPLQKNAWYIDISTNTWLQKMDEYARQFYTMEEVEDDGRIWQVIPYDG